jgi:hypothetical protein
VRPPGSSMNMPQMDKFQFMRTARAGMAGMPSARPQVRQPPRAGMASMSPARPRPQVRRPPRRRPSSLRR